MDNILILLMASCFIVVGLATGTFFCVRITQAAKSKSWPWVIGELESTALRDVVYRGRDSDGGADLASARVVNFRYRYRVKDEDYLGSRVTFSDGVNKTSGALQKLQDQYQGKSQIKVFYRPDQPQQSVLIPGLSIFNFTPLITSALFIAAGTFIGTYDFS